jgi:hypothetical protein
MTGRVVADEDGRPLAGCTVTADGFQATDYPLAWCWLDWRNPQPIVTGADGRFTFTFPVIPGRTPHDGYPPRLHLILRAPDRGRIFGNRHLSMFFDQPDQDLGDFRLPRAAERRFRVVDEKGEVQRGVQLRIRPDPLPVHTAAHALIWFAVQRWDEVTTGEDGTARLESPLVPGQYSIEVTNRAATSGAGTFAIADPPPPAGEPVTIVVATPPVKRTVRGRVVDEDGGTVPDFTLKAMAPPQGNGARAGVSTRSAGDGTFVLVTQEGMGDEFELLHARNSRYDSEHSFGMQRWSAQELVVTIGRPGAIALEVRTASGAVAEDLAIHLLPGDGVAGADPVRVAGHYPGGKVRIDGLRAARYHVTVHEQGARSWPSEPVACDASAQPKTVPIVLREPVARTLHVFTEDGRPVAGALVELLNGDHAQIEQAGQKQGQFRDYGIADRTMTVPSIHDRLIGVVADRAVSDASGKVRLMDLSGSAPVCVRVRGDVVTSVQQLEAWSAGPGAILVKVGVAGSVSGTIAPADFIARLDASPEQDRQQYPQWGIGHNPWFKSRADLEAADRPGIALRQTGQNGLFDSQPFPLAADGTFAIRGVPPGHYDVLLVLREQRGGGMFDRVLEPPLQQIEVAADKTVRLSLTTPEQVQAMNR